jgi:cardiolipin synthase
VAPRFAFRSSRPRAEWTCGNHLELLENGEEFYPRLLDAISGASDEVLLETFIWQEDDIGYQFATRLAAAALRGVRVRITVDGYGTPALSEPFLSRLHKAGVEVRSFDPQPTLFRIRTNLFCRLHRKIAVIDRRTAFVGGLNICDDHLHAFGEESKQDYAVTVTGPVVEQIRRFVDRAESLERGSRWRNLRYWLRRIPEDLRHPTDSAQVLFATRDNGEHPTDIETLYRIAIRNARHEIIIANAYFFPGYRFVRDLREACGRGVRVRLLLQGRPDRPMTIGLASILYDDLAAAGVEIHRYVERPLHAKVAVIDTHWATVGSSNLDPTSLGLNLEANLFILDKTFAAALRGRLVHLIDNACQEFAPPSFGASRIRRLLAALMYHLTRRMATWGRRAVRRPQRIRSI